MTTIGRNNPLQAIRAGRPVYAYHPVTRKELEKGTAQFAIVKAKSDTLAAHRTWEGMRYLLEQVRAGLGKDAEVYLACPQLMLQNETYVTSFYEGNPFLPAITEQWLGKTMADGKPNPLIPRAGVISFVLIARKLKKGENLIKVLRGDKKENPRDCGVMGPTKPEAEVTEGEAILKTKETKVDEDGNKIPGGRGMEDSLRTYATIDQGGEVAYSKVFNAFHGSDSQGPKTKEAAEREATLLYGLEPELLKTAFADDAVDYILNGEISHPMWRVRGPKQRVKVRPNPVDVLKFPIFDLLFNIADRDGEVRDIPHAAEIIASFYEQVEYEPVDMTRQDLILMLQEAALFASQEASVKFSADDRGKLWKQQDKTNIFVLVGASGVGKTTHLEALADIPLRMKAFVEDMSGRSLRLKHYIRSIKEPPEKRKKEPPRAGEMSVEQKEKALAAVEAQKEGLDTITEIAAGSALQKKIVDLIPAALREPVKRILGERILSAEQKEKALAAVKEGKEKFLAALPAELAGRAKEVWDLPVVDSVIPVTTTRTAAADLGSTREEKAVFDSRARWGYYVAADGGAYEDKYALATPDLKRAILRGGTAVMACGPEMAKGLVSEIGRITEQMGGKEAHVTLIYLQERGEVLAANLKHREEVTGRETGDRLEDAREVAKYLRKHVAGKAGVRIVPVGPGQTKVDILKAIRAEIEEVTRAENPETPDLSEVQANSAREELVLRRVLHEIVAALGPGKLEINPSNADTLDKSITDAVGPAYRALLKEIFLSEHGRNPILPHEDVTEDAAAKIFSGEEPLPGFKLVWWVLNHTLLSLAAVLEGRSLPAQYHETGIPRFGALHWPEEPARERAILSRVRQVFNSEPLGKSLLRTLLHDIGKLGVRHALGPSWPLNHERNTYRLLTRLRLTLGFFVPKKEDTVEKQKKENKKKETERRAFELVLKHHHLIGNCFQGAGSPALFAYELLADKEFRALLAAQETAKEKKALVNAMLDDLLRFTITDVAGQGGMGYLAPLRVEEYFRIRDEVGKILEDSLEGLGKEPDNNAWLDGASEKILTFAKDIYLRLAAMVVPLDTPEEMNQRGMAQFYTGAVKNRSLAGLMEYREKFIDPTREKAIETGVFSDGDWKVLEEQFPRIVLPYYDAHYLAAEPSAPEIDTPINMNLLKYLVSAARIAEQVPTGKPVEFVMIDKNGKPATAADKGQEQFAEKLNEAFGLDGNGIPGIKIKYVGERESFKLLERPERTVHVFHLKGGKDKVEFLVDTTTLNEDAERVVVFVRLPGLDLETRLEKIEKARKEG